MFTTHNLHVSTRNQCHPLLQEQLETSKRENTGLLERERRLQMKTKTLQHSLKNEKEEVCFVITAVTCW